MKSIVATSIEPSISHHIKIYNFYSYFKSISFSYLIRCLKITNNAALQNLLLRTNGFRWKNSIVTAVSHAGGAGASEKLFEVRPEPVEGVVYNGPLERTDGENLPHNMEASGDSIDVSGNEEEEAKPDD
jgi:hypothetical protein